MKILLVEDDRDTSELISATLSAHRYAVDVVEDGAAGLDMAAQWNYDLILLDVLLPTLDGIDVCRHLRAQACQTPVLILTRKDSTEDIVAGLDAGADDYLTKSSCDSSQLLARVRALLRRGSGVSASPVLSWGSLCLDPAAARVTYGQEAIALRPKEYALLELFLRYPRRIFNRSAIIDHLWAMQAPPVEGAVTNLIKDLRQRLKAAGVVPDLIETVYGLGYRLKKWPITEPETAKKNPTIAEPETARLATPISATQQAQDRALDHPGNARIQQITERFQGSLAQRIALLESTARSIQLGNLNLDQRQAAHTEAHKLAGGLGTFGFSKASEAAQAIEDLLAENLRQEALLMQQLPQLLETLKQELAQASTQVEKTEAYVAPK